jgi:hypothetical protein
MTSIRKHTLCASLLALAIGGALAQTAAPSTAASAPAQAAAQASTAYAAPSGDGDSIDQRAKRAKALDDAKLATELHKLNPAQPTAGVGSQTRMAARPAIPRAEFYVEAIRGFDDQLEAALVINNKRVTGSKLYPTLTDGWSVNSVTVNGVVITKGKERQSLAFVGPEPYQIATTSSINGVAALPATGGGAMPPGMPMPVGATGR